LSTNTGEFTITTFTTQNWFILAQNGLVGKKGVPLIRGFACHSEAQSTEVVIARSFATKQSEKKGNEIATSTCGGLAMTRNHNRHCEAQSAEAI
jgi:hypothetical protein